MNYNDDDTNSGLFVCKCYKQLLKFQRAAEKVEEVKREIQQAFQAKPRAKCFLHPNKWNWKLAINKPIKGIEKTSLSLTKASSTTCASPYCSQPLLAGETHLIRFVASFHQYNKLDQIIKYLGMLKKHKNLGLISHQSHHVRWETSRKIRK